MGLHLRLGQAIDVGALAYADRGLFFCVLAEAGVQGAACGKTTSARPELFLVAIQRQAVTLSLETRLAPCSTCSPIDKSGLIDKEIRMASSARRKPADQRHAWPRALWMWLLVTPLLVGAAPSVAPVTLSAFLMSSETGGLSPDALTHPELLGNAVGAAASAHAALVRVKVAAERGAPIPSGARVRLVARIVGARATVGGAKGEAGRVLLDRTVRLGPAGADGSAYAGFWLDDVGCAPVALYATVLSAKALHAHADLGFQCYE